MAVGVVVMACVPLVYCRPLTYTVTDGAADVDALNVAKSI